MGSITSRRYFDAPDLNRLIAFSEKTTGDRLPHPTYVKPGDVVWMSYDPRFDRNANIKLWFDGPELVAYAWFEPPLQVSFDISPDSAQYDGIGAEILGHSEDRGRNCSRPKSNRSQRHWPCWDTAPSRRSP
jgi:hypothetical protein